MRDAKTMAYAWTAAALTQALVNADSEGKTDPAVMDEMRAIRNTFERAAAHRAAAPDSRSTTPQSGDTAP